MAKLNDYNNKYFSLTVNNRMHGIELRFEKTLNDSQLAELKNAGFKWSKRQQMWYAYQDSKSVEYATTLVEYYENTMSAQEFNREVEKELEKIIAEDNIQNEIPETASLESLKIFSVEDVENPIEEITVKELSELVHQRAELDRKIASIKEVIDMNGNKLDVSSEQSRDFVLDMNNIQTEPQNKVIQENESIQKEDKGIELSIDDLETAKKFIPPMEYATLLDNATHGEESEYFKQKIKHVADMCHIVYENKDGKSYNEKTKLHDKGFIHYFIGNSDWYVCEVDEDNVGFGFAILNGDTQNAEYGYIDLNEVTTLTLNGFVQTELDIYIDDSISMEHAIVSKYPELKEELIEEEKKIENDKDYAVELADWIIQHSLESSVSQENLTISYDVILEYTDTPEEWLNNPKNIELVNEALVEHNDNELLDYNPEENEEGKFTLYFCSNADETNGENTLFKKNDFGRWVRKSEEELLQEKQEYEKQKEVPFKENIHAEQLTSKKDIKSIREQCREILKKPDNEITETDKVILSQYEGAGGIDEENRTNAGILNEFYTPNNLVEKVWQIVDAYAPNARTVLEPSAGVGKFANNRPNNEFTMHELDETSARINKILHPEANVIQGAYQKQFFDDGERFKNILYEQPKYDVVIGNPPYGTYNDKYKGLGEGREFDRYEEYFISKGLEALKDEKSIMAFVVPSGFLNTQMDMQKEILAKQGLLIDAYRLPEGTFPTTEVGTDIIIMQKWNEKTLAEHTFAEAEDLLSNNLWFRTHQEKILGEVKTRTNRFGKEEEYVAVHEGLTVQDELNKIDGMLPKIEQKQSNEVEKSDKEEKSLQEKIYDKYMAADITPAFSDKEGYAKKISQEIASALETKRGIDIVTIRSHLSMKNEHVSFEEKKLVKSIFEENTGLKLPEFVNDHEAFDNQMNQLISDWANGSEQTVSEIQKTEAAKEKLITSNKEKFDLSKSRTDVMTAEEFNRLYGKDFDEKEFPIWRATNWEGIIDRTKLSFEEENLLHTNNDYVEIEPGVFTHRVLFESGDITAKIESYKNKLSFLNLEEEKRTVELYEKNIEELKKVASPIIPMERLHFGVNSTLAEEFKIEHINSDGEIEKLNLQESFILWAKGQTWEQATGSGYYWRNGIDFATANISEEDLPQNVTWYDIVEYIDRKSVKADRVSTWRKSEEEINADKAQKRKEAEEKRMARSETADRLFDKYLHEGLSPELSAKVESEYNKRFNSYVIPDYSKLPLFIEGMSREKDGHKFKLYDQQIKGVSFLCNKGNGLLAYDVGVGKTAAGIVATVNQIQTGRSKRPLIIVPNAVYAKWYKDIQDLFPGIQVNDLYNLNKESSSKYRNAEDPHKLDIPENSISLVTYEALKNITFTDESCEKELFEDYSKLLSEDFDGSSRENAQSADKIKGVIGAASQVKNSNYVFFEDCGFDNITVDEAHNFKNLWTVPKPKNKGESNEFSGIPTGRPSARALKLFAMTQLTQRHNDDRNVFLLTATPFTNSPLEIYSMLSYVGRKRLIDSGIYSLRDFCTEFAHTKLELGVNSKGDIDQKQVMKDWKELPALQKILTEFIDKVDGEELKEIIRPKKFTHVQEIEMSDLQKQMMQIDTEKMSEVKEGNSAAVIVSMNAMRVGLVAPALADPARYPGVKLPSMQELVETSPKLKFVCDSVIDMYKNNPEKGQFIYMPLGQTAHGIVKDYLINHGLPKEAVEIINGSINNTTDKKAAVTEKFNDPKNKCKILIGGKNTSEGIDLNGNSFVMYNCSLGWNPSETIQAEGRIWRQGNQQGHVHCVYPVMNDSIDSLLYQKHDEKRSRINEIWTYKDSDTLNVEDINPEELKFELIKDPQKRAKLILENGIDTPDYKFTGTKHIQNDLNKVNSRIKSFEETEEKRKNLVENLRGAEINIGNRLKNIEDYKNRGLEVPEWCKMELKEERKFKESYEHQLETISRKYSSWGIKEEKDIEEFIPTMNAKKHELERELNEKKNELPKILKKELLKLNEKKILLPPISEQRKLLTEDIQKNLRPMTEVEPEIRTIRFEQMLSQKWEKGEISNEEKDLYSSVGYKRYYDWLDGEIESLGEVEESKINDMSVSSEIKNVAPEEKIQTVELKDNAPSENTHAVPIEETFLNGGLFSDQTLAELDAINSNLESQKKVHQLITFDSDSGIDEKLEYATLSEAQKAGKKFLTDWELDKNDNGFAVFNKETKQIESTFGYFPVEKAFSKDVLLANGYKTYVAKGALSFPEANVSKIADSAKQRLEEQNTSKEYVDSHISFTGLTKPKAYKETVER